MMFGGEIVQSSYDYDTQTIGPYHIPIEVHYDIDSAQGNAFPLYRYYELLNIDEEALAVFNVNNYCFCLVRKDYIYMVPFSANEAKHKRLQLPEFKLSKPLLVPTYRHVGWVKTYQQCKAVYTWPWKLLEDVNTGEVWSFKEKIKGEPLINPPLALYKYLIETDHRGVYFDIAQNKPVFID